VQQPTGRSPCMWDGGDAMSAVSDAVMAKRIEELLEHSSLGTEGAQRLRGRTSPKRSYGFLRRVREVDDPPTDYSAPIAPETVAAFSAPAASPPHPVDAPVVEQLVGVAVAGDREAQGRLLAEVRSMVLRYCRQRLGRQERVIGSADDVAQEVCLAVLAALPSYTMRGLSFRAFVYGIAAHKVADALRAIGRDRSEPVAELPDTADTHDGPEQRQLAGELAKELGELLHHLAPRLREVLVLRIAAGLSAEEVAPSVG
jgi:RNA polymerase sigma-70 factor (ECF subfamily)